jgi:hypothetical protein
LPDVLDGRVDRGDRRRSIAAHLHRFRLHTKVFAPEPSTPRTDERRTEVKQVSKPRQMIAALLVFAVLSGVSAGAIIAAGNTITIRAGNLILHAAVSMSPRALPRSKMAPIKLRASGSAETDDGTHIPPAKTLELQVDKHMRVKSTGLPSCTAGKVEATNPAQAMKACGGALVGRGVITAQVEFPESAAFNTKGPLLIFNGPASSAGPAYPDMLFYTYVSVPAPTAVVVQAKLTKDSGRYGFTISAKIPRVAGGSGSLTGFELTVNRRWTYRGWQLSYLNAECPDGHLFNQFEATFAAGGPNIEGTLVSSCEPKG